jgi:LPS O-antigen subunit length determinant protein (WzzB/FepE family)
MAIICKLRAYEVKETTGCPSVLRSLSLILGISVLSAAVVLGVCFLAEPTAKVTSLMQSSAPAQVIHQEPVVSSATN